MHLRRTALAEAQSSATGQRRKEDKPLLDPPEIDDETGPIRDTDEVAGWIPGALPPSFQNETGDPYNFKFGKTRLGHDRLYFGYHGESQGCHVDSWEFASSSFSSFGSF